MNNIYLMDYLLIFNVIFIIYFYKTQLSPAHPVISIEFSRSDYIQIGSTKMKLKTLFDKYLHLFFLLGVSPDKPRIKSSTIEQHVIIKCYNILPSLCFIFVAWSSGYYSFDGFSKNDLTFDTCIYAISIALMVLSATIVFKHSSFLRDQESDPQQIWKSFLDLEENVEQKLHIEISFNEFNRIYVKKLSYIWLTFGSLLAIKFAHRITMENIWRQTAVLILLFLAILANIQVLFYVCLLNYIMGLINRQSFKIIDDNSNVKSFVHCGRQIFEHFKILKLLHFKLWNIMQLISGNYGGIMISLMIHNANISIQNFYWIIVELFEDDLSQNIRIISNFQYF